MSIADYGFAIWETFYVTVLSTAFALVLGLPLGVLLVAGDKDIEAGTVSVRSRKDGDEGASSLEDFIARITEEIATKAK